MQSRSQLDSKMSFQQIGRHMGVDAIDSETDDARIGDMLRIRSYQLNAGNAGQPCVEPLCQLGRVLHDRGEPPVDDPFHPGGQSKNPRYIEVA